MFYSPLRYPGGKTSISKYIASVVLLNNSKIYIEPFAGGAGAALTLLHHKIINELYLNDSDKAVYEFWKLVLNDNEYLIKKIENTEVNIEQYLLQEIIFKERKNRIFHSYKKVGFATFFLNRCNRSGILRAGPIGGIEQNGKWKVDARFNKKDLIKRIEFIACNKNKIKIFNLDAIKFIKKIQSKLSSQSNSILFYLDPPYYKNGKQLYNDYYNDKNHIDLANYLKEQSVYKWLLSYDDTPFIQNIYKGQKINGFKMNHFANKAKIGNELLIASDNCLLPKDTIIGKL